MSRDIWKGEEDIWERPAPNVTYRKGKSGFDPKLVEKIIDLYLDGTLSSWAYRSSRSDKTPAILNQSQPIEKVLNSAKDLDPTPLLDAVIKKIDATTQDDTIYEETRILFDPLVQALYQIGENDLFMDLERTGSDYELAKGLRGTEDQPLFASYRSPPLENFGTRTINTQLHLLGDTEYLGEEATTSVFKVNGHVLYVGRHATDCTFKVDSVQQVMDTGWGNTYYIGELKELDRIWSGPFFQNGNRLFLPGDDGSWFEVAQNPGGD